ncbi:MAG: hypothetical protein ACREI3_11365 [Nitrospirales bacterium]
MPKDQPLFFTVFFSCCFLAVLIFWIAIPVYHSELEEKRVEKPLSPEEAIQRAEEVLKRVEETIESVEAEQAKRQKEKASRQGERDASPEKRGTKKKEERRQQPDPQGGKIVQGNAGQAEKVAVLAD